MTDPAKYDPRSNANYYVNLIRTSISQGGHFGRHDIPVPWLRMTLAELEGRESTADEIWQESDFEGTLPAPQITPEY